jgi:phosphinothricin acetyltransferase
MEAMIREATPGDLPGILAIYNEVIATSTASYKHEPLTIEERQSWFEDQRARRYPVFVAADGDKVRGFSTFGPWRGAWAGYRHTVEHTVHVDRQHRGRGIGQALVTALFSPARDMNMHVMIAGIDATNDGSIRFHEKLDFARAGYFREVGWKFDRWLDLVFTQRFL